MLTGVAGLAAWNALNGTPAEQYNSIYNYNKAALFDSTQQTTDYSSQLTTTGGYPLPLLPFLDQQILIQLDRG